MVDCTSQPDGTATLDVLPDIVCWEGGHTKLAFLGLAGLLVYCVLVPLKLFCSLRSSAADGVWTDEELEKGAWMILKVRFIR